ncbi:hypothetical protein QQS21_003099 [Conoideocrella luteorostrata]|uniref:Elongator complex protein 5 n=1 Tax=Conoideocrella luteorostrata TaxID=1105319 RepID=A0AAJ0CX21_9HYPO|nr:hypothetical protein QQS21_003099 [Conoideocrella luteorostrata]
MPPRKTPQKRKSKWDSENILTDPKSPLATADLRTVLSNPLAWTTLNIEERREILSLFPDMAHTLDADRDNARPNFESLLNDDGFRADCAAYVENLARGKHDSEWLRDAWQAHRRRKAGDFDEFLVEKFETDWMELPDEMRSKKTQKAGEESYTAQAESQEDEEAKRDATPRTEPWTDLVGEMAPENPTHTRSHSLLLLQKLLNLRDAASPLTLVLDNLEQPARPVIAEFIGRAKISKVKVILLSFATVKKPKDVDVVVTAAGKDLRIVVKELVGHYPATDAAQKPSQRAVIIIDSINNLASSAASTLSGFLSSIITPTVSIISIYHTDVPIILPKSFNEYEPHPFIILSHLATAILRLSSLSQEIDRQKARNRAVQEPEWGLKEGREGVIVGLKSKSSSGGDSNVVIEMELRRKSGRSVTENFILAPGQGKLGTGKLMLLTDYSIFAAPEGNGTGEEEEEPQSTFNLGLTDKQKKDREGIVLPYFDAQTDIGAGEGGRILYEMGREDDFDDEEDEI